MQKLTKKYRRQIIIFLLSVAIIFSITTFLSARYDHFKAGPDYYGFPLTFYDSYDNYTIGEDRLNYFHLSVDLTSTIVLIIFLRYLINFFSAKFKNSTSFPASYFGLTYLSLIPIYACIYFFMPNQFYSNTSNMERLTEGFEKRPDLQYEITHDIVNTLSKNFQKEYNCDYVIGKRGDTLFNPIGTNAYGDEALVEIEGEYFRRCRSSLQPCRCRVLSPATEAHAR
ncbi:MAG: hypothetical protein JWQ09_1098 [Segetibacter sp.]|nr:hypothetical protein [Segetibacter sp.]